MYIALGGMAEGVLARFAKLCRVEEAMGLCPCERKKKTEQDKKLRTLNYWITKQNATQAEAHEKEDEGLIS